jgi:23S rRNA-/tRNA-specific pseudouridylate synthase
MQAKWMQAKASTGVDMKVIFEDEHLAVVFKPGE